MESALYFLVLPKPDIWLYSEYQFTLQLVNTCIHQLDFNNTSISRLA